MSPWLAARLPFTRPAMGMLPALSTLLAVAVPVTAQEQAPGGLRAPPRSFALPMEIEHDFGAANGEATIFRFLPLWSVPLSESWRLVNLELVTLADAPGGVPGGPIDPNPTPGDRAFGLSDLIHGSFLTPEDQETFIWGAGLILGIPTATDEVLGSGKWAAGPAVRLTFRTGPWNLGAVAGQRWSFAGDASRPDLNALIIRGAFRFKLPGPWYLVSAPIITANWNAPSSERWLVPLGGGPGITFGMGEQRWATSLQGYVNAVKPEGAPEWAARVQLITAIPY
jgi:hypothetical protein